MCLWIEQTKGNLADLAKQAWQAVKDGDIDTAERIYQSVTGKTFSPHNRTLDSGWLRYCMPDCIKSHYDIDMSDVPYTGNDDSHYFGILRYRAERKYGGTWTVNYEY